jgi:hypothetical protein
MAGLTNRGKNNILATSFRATAISGSSFNGALYTSATTPDADDNVHTDLTQIATGNGYSDGGAAIARDATDWDVLTEDDTNDRALVQLKDIVFTASGGSIPASGDGARYFGLLDNNATVNSRELWAFWDLTSDRTVSTGQTLTIQDAEIRLTE